MRPCRLLVALALALLPAPVFAQPVAPALSSRAGAAYTVYLNFSGFNFTGTWGGTYDNGGTPGVTAAYTADADASTFSTAEQANIKNVWSRVAEKYAAFNVNVTTVDPSGLAATNYSGRQAYYDNTPRVMQTVIGGSGDWFPNAGGVSYLGVTQNAYSPTSPTIQNGGAGAGLHTNFVFAGLAPANLPFVAEATAHEQGHGLSLDHQSLWSGGALVAEYHTGTGTGAASVAPIMGDSYSAQRGVWRVGATPDNSSTGAQNDVALLLSNAGMTGTGAGGLMDSGVGHTRPTATSLPLTGTAINPSAAAGLIAPKSASTPLGAANYTTDYFSFAVGAGGATLSVNLLSGRQSGAPGTADDGATLNATLRLLDAVGNLIAVSDTGVLSEAILADLPAGTYYLEITSAGGQIDPNGYSYFDMGSYFLTGNLTPVPEPAGLLAAAAGLAVVVRWRRRAAQAA